MPETKTEGGTMTTVQAEVTRAFPRERRGAKGRRRAKTEGPRPTTNCQGWGGAGRGGPGRRTHRGNPVGDKQIEGATQEAARRTGYCQRC